MIIRKSRWRKTRVTLGLRPSVTFVFPCGDKRFTYENRLSPCDKRFPPGINKAPFSPALSPGINEFICKIVQMSLFSYMYIHRYRYVAQHGRRAVFCRRLRPPRLPLLKSHMHHTLLVCASAPHRQQLARHPRLCIV